MPSISAFLEVHTDSGLQVSITSELRDDGTFVVRGMQRTFVRTNLAGVLSRYSSQHAHAGFAVVVGALLLVLQLHLLFRVLRGSFARTFFWRKTHE